jgi:hypothetical protein
MYILGTAHPTVDNDIYSRCWVAVSQGWAIILDLLVN